MPPPRRRERDVGRATDCLMNCHLRPANVAGPCARLPRLGRGDHHPRTYLQQPPPTASSCAGAPATPSPIRYGTPPGSDRHDQSLRWFGPYRRLTGLEADTVFYRGQCDQLVSDKTQLHPAGPAGRAAQRASGCWAIRLAGADQRPVRNACATLGGAPTDVWPVLGETLRRCTDAGHQAAVLTPIRPSSAAPRWPTLSITGPNRPTRPGPLTCPFSPFRKLRPNMPAAPEVLPFDYASGHFHLPGLDNRRAPGPCAAGCAATLHDGPEAPHRLLHHPPWRAAACADGESVRCARTSCPSWSCTTSISCSAYSHSLRFVPARRPHGGSAPSRSR